MLLKFLPIFTTADILSVMKSIIKKRTWKAIYRLLDRVSPIDGDCGRLCGAACCTCGDAEKDGTEEDLGIYLYPGEHKFIIKKLTGSAGPLRPQRFTSFPKAGQVPFTWSNARHLLYVPAA